MHEKYAIIWDLETIPDLEAAARLFDMVGEDEDAIRDELGRTWVNVCVEACDLRPTYLVSVTNGAKLT